MCLKHLRNVVFSVVVASSLCADFGLAAGGNLRSLLMNRQGFSSAARSAAMQDASSLMSQDMTKPQLFNSSRTIFTPSGRKIVQQQQQQNVARKGLDLSPSSNGMSLRQRLLQTPQQGLLQQQAIPTANGNTGVMGVGLPNSVQQFRMKNRIATGGQLLRKSKSGVMGFGPSDITDAISDGADAVGGAVSDGLDA
jgi:hypothetical protein